MRRGLRVGLVVEWLLVVQAVGLIEDPLSSAQGADCKHLPLRRCVLQFNPLHDMLTQAMNLRCTMERERRGRSIAEDTIPLQDQQTKLCVRRRCRPSGWSGWVRKGYYGRERMMAMAMVMVA